MRRAVRKMDDLQTHIQEDTLLALQCREGLRGLIAPSASAEEQEEKRSSEKNAMDNAFAIRELANDTYLGAWLPRSCDCILTCHHSNGPQRFETDQSQKDFLYIDNL